MTNFCVVPRGLSVDIMQRLDLSRQYRVSTSLTLTKKHISCQQLTLSICEAANLSP
jgi:hypothetical protein